MGILNFIPVAGFALEISIDFCTIVTAGVMESMLGWTVSAVAVRTSVPGPENDLRRNYIKKKTNTIITVSFKTWMELSKLWKYSLLRLIRKSDNPDNRFILTQLLWTEQKQKHRNFIYIIPV